MLLLLLYSQAGVSRSATVVLAYLMVHQHATLADALDMVTARRRAVDPNPGFRAQLATLEAALATHATADAAWAALVSDSNKAAVAERLLREAAAVVQRYRRVGLPRRAIEHKCQVMGVTLADVEAVIEKAKLKAESAE